MTIDVPIVTCLHRVRRIHKARVRRPRPRPPNTQSRSTQRICIVFLQHSYGILLTVLLSYDKETNKRVADSEVTVICGLHNLRVTYTVSYHFDCRHVSYFSLAL